MRTLSILTLILLGILVLVECKSGMKAIPTPKITPLVNYDKTTVPPTPQSIQFASQYKLTGFLSLPYANLAEPVTVYYDGVNYQQRIEYYSGTDIYTTQAKLHGGSMWSVNPVIDKQQCFFSWDIAQGANPQSLLTPYIPNLSMFTTNPVPVSLYGETAWQLTYVMSAGVNNEVNNTYNFYVSASSPYTPIYYEMMGYDSLLGSHYDQYMVFYQSYVPNYFDESVFDMPTTTYGQCNNQTTGGGPSISFEAPHAQYRLVFPPAPSDIKTITPEYKQFASTYGKAIGDESISRQRIFHYNNLYISAHNRQYRSGVHTYSLKLNHLADWSKNELRVLRGKKTATYAPAPQTHKLSNKVLPAAVDWRANAVSPVQDQAVCGSCWSFGSSGTITGAYAIMTGKIIDFSQQQLMDCSWNFGNAACGGGEDFLAYQYIMQAGGLQSMADYGPYTGQDQFCKPSSSPNTVAVIQSYVNLTGTTALLDAIYTQGPISVSINASPDSFTFYHSGVYANTNSNPNLCPGGAENLDHSVLAVGFGIENGQQYYLIKNSWSSYWGDFGYIKISTALDTCGVADMPTYVVLAN